MFPVQSRKVSTIKRPMSHRIIVIDHREDREIKNKIVSCEIMVYCNKSNYHIHWISSYLEF